MNQSFNINCWYKTLVPGEKARKVPDLKASRSGAMDAMDHGEQELFWKDGWMIWKVSFWFYWSFFTANGQIHHFEWEFTPYFDWAMASIANCWWPEVCSFESRGHRIDLPLRWCRAAEAEILRRMFLRWSRFKQIWADLSTVQNLLFFLFFSGVKTSNHGKTIGKWWFNGI